MNIANSFGVECLPSSKYDVIISSSNPYSSHRAVSRLIQKGIKANQWIEYWGDPLSNDVSRTNLVPEFILRHLEYNLLKDADKVVFVSPLTMEYEKRVHCDIKKKMSWLPIPYLNITSYQSGEYISYFGDYYKKNRNIMPLYEALVEFGRPSIIAGDGDCEIESQGNVKVYPRCNIRPFVEKTRVLVVVLNKQGTQIPGKFYHCAGSSVPVLVICDGSIVNDVKKYFSSYEKYWFCENSKNSIKEALLQIDSEYRLSEPINDFRPEKIAIDFLS